MSHQSDTDAVNYEYSQFIESRVKDPKTIIFGLDIKKVNLIHAIMGISGEAGELLDAIKKHVIYNKPLDYNNVLEELGDIEFYLEQIRQELGFTREQCLLDNMGKLSKRYAAGYTDQQAIDRADKK